MNRDVKPLSLEPFWQRQPRLGRQVDIEYSCADIAIKMVMLAHVRAKMGRTAIERHLPDQAAFDQRVQTIINGSHGDIGQIVFGPDEDLFGGRMIAFVQ